MTRISPARLLRAGILVLAAALAIALSGCGGGGTSATAPASSHSPARASASASPANGVIQPTGTPDELKVDPRCLVTSAQAQSILGPGVRIIKSNSGCYYGASQQRNIVIAELSSKQLNNPTPMPTNDPVSHPSYFRTAYVSTQDSYTLTDTSGSPVDMLASEAFAPLPSGKNLYLGIEPPISRPQLVRLFDQVMVWYLAFDVNASPALSAPGSVRAPDLAACKVLPSSIFPDLLGGAAVTSFEGSTATLCTLNTANPGVKGEIAYRPISQADESTAMSQLTSVGNNVWEEDTSTYMTFVNGMEIGVESDAQVNVQPVVAALAALNS